MILFKQQHPKVHACIPLNDGPRRYLEVYVTKNNDINAIATNGPTFKDCNLTVLPCPALTDTDKIINVKLSHLLLLTKDDVLAGLQQSLAVFGKVIDLGIITESATGLFMGTGYAVLNVYQDSTTTENKLQERSHQISWCESDIEFFHATWNNMPTWCRYCHQEGHTKFECLLSKARIICYSCHQQGRRSFECPRRCRYPSVQSKKSPEQQKTPKELDDDSNDSNFEEGSSDSDQ